MHKFNYILLLFVVLNCKPNNLKNYKDSCEEINGLMYEQEESWNKGNIEDFMKKYWKNDSLIFVGKSGAGKSTITSKLTGKSLKTQSLKKSRGLHTTSISSLYSVEKNIEIIDSPGTRDLDISNIKKIDILSAFWEINEASKNCKFSDCRHIDEKNCAVQLGLKTNKIATSRYNNFLDFINNE